MNSVENLNSSNPVCVTERRLLIKTSPNYLLILHFADQHSNNHHELVCNI